jgi:hypothetical protein
MTDFEEEEAQKKDEFQDMEEMTIESDVARAFRSPNVCHKRPNEIWNELLKDPQTMHVNDYWHRDYCTQTIETVDTVTENFQQSNCVSIERMNGIINPWSSSSMKHVPKQASQYNWRHLHLSWSAEWQKQSANLSNYSNPMWALFPTDSKDLHPAIMMNQMGKLGTGDTLQITP